jgi:hypothetical protein
LRSIGGGGRAGHRQKAIFHARKTDIAEHVTVEFERHAALAKAHPQVLVEAAGSRDV